MAGRAIIGSEALRAGRLSRHELRRDYVRWHKDVYVPRGLEITPALRAEAAWLRSRRRGVLAGFSAAALHGARWIDPALPAEIIDVNRRRERGVRGRALSVDAVEECTIDGMRVTTAARTAFDLACDLPLPRAVPALDALARAADVRIADLEGIHERHSGRRGIRRCWTAIDLMDAGAESPKETWLRLVLVTAGLPRPQTQILVHNGDHVPLAYIDMGWEDMMVGVEYDGDQHRSDRRQYVKDIKRLELLERLGWRIVRVVAEDHPDDVVRRVKEALARRRSIRAA
ncbi:cullin, a subunit of E3 ubiquitin ligase [Mycobacteroides abscessus subsp. massiliense]|uniref:hypothetical protein n=1 Tax=Mycobacteroides abscessus TaxID=36809 RepID=UPI00037920BA|nr:hypothetical protein [Mycobacteroides abscessus]NOS00986.1 hypothetical protein [Mycobacteroides abscessus]SKF87055.1 cullin, a subunit of E3 ubiquitin ligase [Mycobacteroides abscessus subsp. massiliense]SKG42635.1 cullin, a subunit of E3 ubiquitin ligase [Mycobacteroides abscessus subsp. massiliense]SKI12171.1 cullin, a subunit of E3 ubiquitin ligase [Mycobacteroides abscessus subsp. massiliense]SKK30242.1 cullin, a subunit of E3 ubiquitin ligase [Mycobacteroides abscessus subsp. massilie